MDRDGDSGSPTDSGTSRVAPACFGKALAELVDVDDGRDIVGVESWTETECGMVAIPSGI